MGISVTKDLVWQNTDGEPYCVLDMSGWDYAIVQVFDYDTAISTLSTNDIENYNYSVNASLILSTNINNGNTFNSITDNGVYKIENFGKYVIFQTYISPQFAKIKAMLYKIG